MIVILALLLQVLMPVVENYVYAEEEVGVVEEGETDLGEEDTTGEIVLE